MRLVLVLIIQTILIPTLAAGQETATGLVTAEPFASKEEYRQSILGRSFVTVFSVTDASDAPDDSIGDNIYFPPTLRSAIQNANKTPGPHLIDLNPALPAVLQPTSALPNITTQVALVGHDKTLDGSLVIGNARGLYIFANGCLITDLHIRNFNDGGMHVSGNADTIKGVEITQCDGAGINMNNTDGCVIGGKGIYIRNKITHLTGSGGYGISMIANSNNNLVEGNFIGNDGIDSLPNSRYGILLESHGNIIRGNVISGNAYGGIHLNDNASYENVIENNYIGTDQGGTLPIPFQGYGINILRSANDTIRNNVISGGNDRALSISNTASGIYISGNLIGVDTSGGDTLRNDGAGITSSGTDVFITGNTISGNSAGVAFFQGNGTLVGNMIGTDITGTKIIGNRGNGVELSGGMNTIGGILAPERNIISGNGYSGINSSFGGGTVIEGNYIGTDITGTVPLPNLYGVIIRGNTRSLKVKTNVISGNVYDGVRITKIVSTIPDSNVISGNYIGLGANGQDTISNGGDGIYVNSARYDTIGGPGPLDANYISSNGRHGIHLQGGSTDHIVVFNNYIGVGFGGVPRPNLAGIVIDSARDNSIGAVPYADPGNTIAFNVEDGVRVTGGDTASGNAIRYNSIFENGDLGIDLNDDGVTANDTSDADTGPNTLINFPVVTLTTPDTAFTRFVGEYHGIPHQPYSLDFYANDVCDAPGNGEGSRYMGTENIQTDSTGFAMFDAMVPTKTGMFFTSTATDTSNNTSEFSKCRPGLPPGLYADVGVSIDDSVDLPETREPGDTLKYLIVVHNFGPDTAKGIHLTDSLFGSTYLDDSTLVGSVGVAGSAVTWDIAILSAGEEATLTIRSIVVAADSVRSGVEISTISNDPNPDNDEDTDSTSIGPTTDIADGPVVGLPLEFRLGQNYPNPFNPTTGINIDLPSAEVVRLVVYDVLGRSVARLIDGAMSAGRHSIRWDASGVESGVYFYRIQAGTFTDTRKMILIR